MNFQVSYQWLPPRMLGVQFQEYFKFDENLFGKFFFGRAHKIGPGMAWESVVCKPDEWRKYLVFLYGALARSGQVFLIQESEVVLAEITRFDQWHESLKADPFYVPDGELMA